MDRKAVFALAAIFLAVAVIVPPALFILQADNDLDNLIATQNNQGLSTSGNITITDQTGESHTNNIIIFAVIEAVFLPAFAITLYFGMNHPKPHPEEEQETQEESQKPKT
jgi:hypothetical protein